MCVELQHPLAIVTPTLDGDVLRVLAGADSEFTPPEVWRLIDEYSEDGVRRSLQRLVGQGIVLQRRAGHAWLYRLNRDHVGAAAVIALAGLREEVLRRIAARVGDWPVQAAYVALFGSGARGEMRAASDIDLFVVRRDAVDPLDDAWATQLSELSQDAHRWTGNDTRVLEYSEAEVREGIELGDPVLVSIRDEGIWLSGVVGLLGRRVRVGAGVS